MRMEAARFVTTRLGKVKMRNWNLQGKKSERISRKGFLRSFFEGLFCLKSHNSFNKPTTLPKNSVARAEGQNGEART